MGIKIKLEAYKDEVMFINKNGIASSDCTMTKILAYQEVAGDWVEKYTGSGLSIEIKDLDGRDVLTKVIINGENSAELQKALRDTLKKQLVDHEAYLSQQLRRIKEVI